MRARTVLPVFLFVSVLLLLLPAAALAVAAPTYDQAVDQIYASGQPQQWESYLNSLGSSPLGFRLAGSPADNQAARWLAARFKEFGLANVRLEAVPVDAWDVRGASVQIAGRTLTASQFAGVHGTPLQGVTGDVVYVNEGTAFDYAGKDVRGKIVLVDSALDWWWLNYPGSEAAYRGAKAVIYTYGEKSYPWYARPNALGGNDGEYDLSYAPLVYISWQDGDWLKQQMAAGPVSATVKSDVRIQLADEGGVGYNVVAEIPGSVKNGEKVIVVSHHDAHFRAGLDDTGAVVNELVMAKALKMSGAKPKRTLIFLSDTAEEYGYTNCWYDWCIGAWWFITRAHPDYAGKLAGMINLEGMAGRGALELAANPDNEPWMKELATRWRSLLPYGFSLKTPLSTWEDGWTFGAAGVPGVYIAAWGDLYDEVYHTNLETADLIDWSYMPKIAKFVYRVHGKLDTGLLPYSPKARADDLAAAANPAELSGAHADQAKVNRFLAAVTRFKNAANGYEARKTSIPSSKLAAVNTKLMALEKTIGTNYIGLDIWDYTAYPWQQVMWDIQYLDQAIAWVEGPTPQPGKALAALENVGLTWNGEFFSYDVYKQDLTRHAPDHKRITWAAQGHEAPHLDVMPQWRMIERGEYAAAAADLKAMRDAEVTELNTRLDWMASVTENVAGQVEALK